MVLIKYNYIEFFAAIYKRALDDYVLALGGHMVGGKDPVTVMMDVESFVRYWDPWVEYDVFMTAVMRNKYRVDFLRDHECSKCPHPCDIYNKAPDLWHEPHYICRKDGDTEA